MKNRVEKERGFWNSFAKKYDGFIKKNSSKTYEILLIKLLNDTKHSENLLEVATGTGIIALELSKQVSTVSAVDIAPEMIEIAKKKCEEKSISNINFSVGDSYNLNFEDNSFDIVIASNVLHLMFQPEKAIQEMSRVLRDKGQIIIPTFCHGYNLKTHALSRILRLFGFRVQSRWSENSFKDFARNNGLEIIESEVILDKIPLIYLRTELPKLN